jgi:hypothetical protein
MNLHNYYNFIMNLSQYFDNNSDCYTQVDRGDGELLDEMALSKAKFIELVYRLIPNDAQMDGEVQQYLSRIGMRDKPIRSEKDRSVAKKHFEEGFKAAIRLLSGNCH